MKKNAAVCLATLALCASYAEVKFSTPTEKIPTYPVAPADVNPQYYTGRVYQGARGEVYPYPMYDILLDERVEQEYKKLELENEYVKIDVIPELGGRIFSATDKATGYEFFYRQHVIKPALIGMIGAWISGGVEWNVPHHHRPSTHLPVDYAWTKNPDGSFSAIVGETELRHRMKWSVQLTLYPGKSYVEARVKVFNATPFMQTMLYWANVSVHCGKDYEVIFPPKVNVGVSHHKNMFVDWPVGNGPYDGADRTGIALNLWQNHFKSCSIFARDFEDDFLAGYDHTKDGGTVHFANHRIVNGKKFFLWGNCRASDMWEKMLTEKDGQYLELMVGAYSDNQPDYSWIAPGETREFTQYWYPVSKIGGVKAAKREGAVNVERRGADKLFVGFNVTEKCDGAKVAVAQNGVTIFEKIVNIDPDKPFTAEIAVDKNAKDEDLRASIFDASGKELVGYQKAQAAAGGKLPEPVVVERDPKKYKTIEELYLTGVRLEQFHNAILNPEDFYAEALLRDPQDMRANTAMGIRRAKKARFDEAKEYLSRAAARATKNYTNPRDAESLYYLGVVAKYDGDFKTAKDMLWKAAWRNEFRVPAYSAIAQIEAAQGNFGAALEAIDDALASNARSPKNLAVKAYVLRKLGRSDEAVKVSESAIAYDRLDYFAAFENAFASGKDLTPIFAQAGDVAANALEVACGYLNMGAYSEAVKVLEAAQRAGAKSPLINYYVGFAKEKLGDVGGAQKARAEAAETDGKYCFPFRIEELYILKSATAANPNDAAAHLYLGNIEYFFEMPDAAIASWQKAVSLNKNLAQAYRNIGFALGGKGDWTGAVSAYKNAISANPDDARFYLELDKASDRINGDAATRLKFLEDNKQTVFKRDDATLEMLSLYNCVGRYDDAIDVFAKRHLRVWEGGGDVHGVFVDSHLLRGLKRAAAGDKRAVEDFEAALGHPDNIEVGEPYDLGRLAEICALAGDACEKLKDSERAKAYYEKALTTLNTTPEQLVFAAYALEKLGRKAEADKLREKLAPEIAAKENNIGKFDFFSKFGGDFHREKLLSESVSLKGTDALLKGDKAAAAKFFKRATELYPNNIWAKYRLETLK